jgi:hypothetical protein
MSWSVRWHLLAERDFHDIPHWETAARIDAAVQLLAATGEGPLRRIETPHGAEHRLLVPPYFVRVSRDRGSRTLHVWRIVRYA